MKEFINILKYKLVWLYVLLLPLFAAASYYIPYSIPILYILLSNLYDILGYHFTLIRRLTYLPEKEYVRSYRLIQLMFDLTLALLIAVIFGWIASLSGLLLKLFGIQDLLYYVFLKKPFPKIWTWMKWTPLGLLKGKLTFLEIIIQGCIGIILSALIIIVY